MTDDPLEQQRRDPRNYKWGVFYVAPQDPRLWVPKRFGIGWTLNFAHRGSWLWLFVILGVAAATVVITSQARPPR